MSKEFVAELYMRILLSLFGRERALILILGDVGGFGATSCLACELFS